MTTTKTIALLGQPNSGKSTLFNNLTGLHQHVGNWPGKTVERAEGFFDYNDVQYKVVDLPGSYGLSANSEEEVVTRNFIWDGKADLICILVDASQLERSLYMLADFVGIKAPVMLVLNMMDVAEAAGKKIDVKAIEKKLGVPVLGFSAADTKRYPDFLKKLDEAISHPSYIDSAGLREEMIGGNDSPVYVIEKILDDTQLGNVENIWLAVKLLENDKLVQKVVNDSLPFARRNAVKCILSSAEGREGGIATGEAKYRWISKILKETCSEKTPDKVFGKWDRIATHRIKGKIFSFVIMVVALLACMILAFPGMGIGFGLQPVLQSLVEKVGEALGLWTVVVSFINNVLVGGTCITICMTSFIFSIIFVFRILEEIGYMARFSYAFDNWLSRLGLHGKAIMPLFSGIGCTAGAVCGTRVLDTRGQRLFALVLLWAIPCGSKVAVVLFLASTFFGSAAPFFAIGYVALIFLSFWLSSLLFGKKLIPENERVGMIMELPPYHKPHWKMIAAMVGRSTWGIFKKALKMILIVAAIFWALSYASDGNVENTILYKIGNAIEPVTMFFGMRWELFVSYLGGMFSKEASLGIMSTLFNHTGEEFSLVTRVAASENLGEVLAKTISKPEALAFLFASMFNVPCVLAMGTTYREVGTIKWLATIMGYYIALSLGLAFIGYHIGLLIF